MNRRDLLGSLAVGVGLAALEASDAAPSLSPKDSPAWTIYIANDTCPDYTWGNDEATTRRNFAELIRSHLDEMNRDESEAPENRDHYAMAVALEAICFLEAYPERKAELIRRIREGRICVSPFLCNTLWALQSSEGAIRSLYEARRLEREWGVRLDVAEHIENPSLPWGMATILAGCGVKWLSVPFLDYDTTFSKLANPPLFALVGPDGSRLNVILDAWASLKANYVQGANLLQHPDEIEREWLPHYESLGAAYPIRSILASGTHGDASPNSASQTRGFAAAIRDYNARPDRAALLKNATLADFRREVEAFEAKTPFLPVLKGCFGHSWDLWAVSLAPYVSKMREGESVFLTAESLIAAGGANRSDPGDLFEATRAERETTERDWVMLSDHAWNGSDDANRKVNADLRKRWSDDLMRGAESLLRKGWEAAERKEDDRRVSLFNGMSAPRSDLARIEAPSWANGIRDEDGHPLPSQIVDEEGKRILHFVSPRLPGFGFAVLEFSETPFEPKPDERASDEALENRFYRLEIDPATGGIRRLIHRATGCDLVAGEGRRSLGQVAYAREGKEIPLSAVETKRVESGPAFSRLRLACAAGELKSELLLTLYHDLDRIDFDYRIRKPIYAGIERLTHVFPILRDGGTLHLDATGALIRPYPQPKGDLLPGADANRFAVQEFIRADFPHGPSVLFAPLDAFMLRLDLDAPAFEALGNDQNHREVTRDQDGATTFRFRYSLRATEERGFAEAFRWGRAVRQPIVATTGRIDRETKREIAVDPKRALATCFKPAESGPHGAVFVRLREIAGEDGPTEIEAKAYRRAWRTDSLEREIEETAIEHGRIRLSLARWGFAGLRLDP